jgi:two-component system CheB/CheR fusion protein
MPKTSKKGKKTAEKRGASLKPAGKAAGTKDFPIVGLGASAGGLEALEGFFTAMPADTGIAFVVIQHLDPRHKSIMAEILERHTKLTVRQVEDGMKVQPNTLYLNPPGLHVALMSGSLYLLDSSGMAGGTLPIDHFFKTLASDQGERSICIILSGTGMDGTHGLREVKAAGGMAMVQEPQQAGYDGMPTSAVDTGLVDFILPVEDMPAELIKYIRHPYIKAPERRITTEGELQSHLPKIFMLIRSATGHDFSKYKLNTIRRRIERRMAVHQINAISDYVRYLQGEKEEVDILFKDLLITVTNFFRDPEAFDLLKEKVIPAMLSDRPAESPIRIWIPGCATGEEAYSSAILLAEAMEEANTHYTVQIFATDIDAEAVDFARAGLYPSSIAGDVSEDRLKRFFRREDDSYRITKRLREMVVFATQNVIKDPPFSKLDMVSCRNLLIYFGPPLQKKVIPLFHYTLKPEGILFLGSSESIGEFADLFTAVNTKWKIFRRKGGFPVRNGDHLPFQGQGKASGVAKSEGMKGADRANLREMMEKVILDSYSPPALLINERFDILYFQGKTERYLSPPAGEPTYNLLKLIREELVCTVSATLHKVMRDKKAEVVQGLKIHKGGKVRHFDLAIRPFTEPESLATHMMVVFEKSSLPDEKKLEGKRAASKGGKEEGRILDLEKELQTTKEYLQTTIEELETSNEALKSTNEELQSTNEELQSTNEELETSKEELHSTNEELQTVNAELQYKLDELSKANDDLNNLLSSTEIGTIFLDNDLRIKRFTPAAAGIFNLIKGDVNRPISDITSKLIYEDLCKDAEEVLDTLNRKKMEVPNGSSNAGRTVAHHDDYPLPYAG